MSMFQKKKYIYICISDFVPKSIQYIYLCSVFPSQIASLLLETVS